MESLSSKECNNAYNLIISFHVIEKSPPAWTTLGQTISLNCKTSHPWNMCRWVMPNGDTCDSLTTDMYEVSCARNPRVKFKVNLRGSSQYVPIRASMVDFLQARPPQWQSQSQCAAAASALFYSAKPGQTAVLPVLPLVVALPMASKLPKLPQEKRFT